MTATDTAPRSGGLPLPLRYVEAQARRYRRTARASIVTNFVGPVLLLLAMGVGLGTLVDDRGGVDGLDYLTFVAPALLANAGLQTAHTECTWPVMGGFKWTKSYTATLASPLSMTDLVVGHWLWAIVRVVQVSAIFAVVLVAFGIASPLRALAALGPTVLVGAAYGAFAFAFTSRLEDESALSSLYRFVMVPMFLFSGSFFPVSQLPDAIEPLAWVLPLWHAVVLDRALIAGVDTPWPWWAHVLAMTLWVPPGLVLARRWLSGKLLG